MAIRIGRNYIGRFHNKAKSLIEKGTRVGMMWIANEENVHCHICDKSFKTPDLDKVYKDCFGECPYCKTPFVFAKWEN